MMLHSQVDDTEAAPQLSIQLANTDFCSVTGMEWARLLYRASHIQQMYVISCEDDA